MLVNFSNQIVAGASKKVSIHGSVELEVTIAYPAIYQSECNRYLMIHQMLKNLFVSEREKLSFHFVFTAVQLLNAKSS